MNDEFDDKCVMLCNALGGEIHDSFCSIRKKVFELLGLSPEDDEGRKLCFEVLLNFGCMEIAKSLVLIKEEHREPILQNCVDGIRNMIKGLEMPVQEINEDNN